jgi:N-acetylglutamate synthase-like GNAT family acetyltransferase
MIVRPATKFDCPKVIEMLRHFSEQDRMPGQLKDDKVDWEYISSLYRHLLLGGGLVIVVEKDKEVIGFILGMKNSNIWYPNQISMNELVFWVEPEHRNSRAGYMLIKEFNKTCEQMKQKKEITMYTMTKTKHFDQVNYERFGYSKIEETWAVGV